MRIKFYYQNISHSFKTQMSSPLFLFSFTKLWLIVQLEFLKAQVPSLWMYTIKWIRSTSFGNNQDFKAFFHMISIRQYQIHYCYLCEILLLVWSKGMLSLNTLWSLFRGAVGDDFIWMMTMRGQLEVLWLTIFWKLKIFVAWIVQIDLQNLILHSMPEMLAEGNHN